LADDLRDLCERSAQRLPLDDSEVDQYYYPIEGLADDNPEFLARQANLDTFMDLVDEYISAQPRGDFESFEEWADTVLARRDIGLRGKGVKLSTIHRGKGLEWSAVAIMGLVEGALPSRHVRSAADLEESARVAYVAMTRASRELVCTWSQTTTMGTPVLQATRPSRFFVHLSKVDGTTRITQVADSAERVDPETATRLVRELRQTLRRGAVDSRTD
jgi:DNA helicase-2/ATP-dependent DNA helicase PcrA